MHSLPGVGGWVWSIFSGYWRIPGSRIFVCSHGSGTRGVWWPKRMILSQSPNWQSVPPNQQSTPAVSIRLDKCKILQESQNSSHQIVQNVIVRGKTNPFHPICSSFFPIFHTHCPGCQLVRGFVFGHLWTARKKTNLPSNLSTSIIAPAVLPSFEAVIVLVNLSAPHFTNSRPPICLWGQMPITRNSRSHKTYNRNATNPMEKPQA